MPLDNPKQNAALPKHTLTARSAEGLLRDVLANPAFGRVALVSSFGAEAVVLLHMVSTIAPDTPVLFLDTEMLFPETIAYQRKLTVEFGLTDVRRLRPDREHVFHQDPDGILHLADPDACCDLRKTQPLDRALQGFDTWITGRKRFQAKTRETLPVIETDGDRLKVNPLADWLRNDVAVYIERHNLPRHPLVESGYPSIGCSVCTTRVRTGEEFRAGRWRGREKSECGIHFVNGKMVRTGTPDDKDLAQ